RAGRSSPTGFGGRFPGPAQLRAGAGRGTGGLRWCPQPTAPTGGSPDSTAGTPAGAALRPVLRNKVDSASECRATQRQAGMRKKVRCSASRAERWNTTRLSFVSVAFPGQFAPEQLIDRVLVVQLLQRGPKAGCVVAEYVGVLAVTAELFLEEPGHAR